MNYTPEQTRRIEAAVAETIGYEWKASPYPGVIMLLPVNDDRFIPRFSTDYQAWAIAERWMVENFKGARQARYARSITKIPEKHYTSIYNIGVIGFVVATTPLPLRCLALLRAMGVDTDALLAEVEAAVNEVTE